MPPSGQQPTPDPPNPAAGHVARRYDRAFEDAAIGMAIEGLDGRFLAVNAALCDLVGYSREQLLTMAYPQICHPDDLENQEHLSGLAEGRIPRYIRELRYVRADGEQIWVRVHVGVARDDSGAVIEYVVQIEDVSARKEAERRLAYQADHDALTGLPNRHALARHLDAVDGDAGQRCALLFVDLDRFKLVNDSLGHTIGDELLLAVAGRLRHAIPSGDMVARIGGDEFVVVAQDAADVEVARGLAARLQDALAAPFSVGGHRLHLTVSVGVALSDPDEPVASLLRAADLAMHRAKAAGRARAVLFHRSMISEAENRRAIEQGLHQGVASGELSCWFQPIVSLVTGRTVAAEALVRWTHPDGRVLVPAEFLEVAEESGLAVTIGRQVLAGALDEVKTWRARNIGTVVNINLSGSQLDDPGLVDEILLGLYRRGLRTSDLCLEVSETALLVPGGTAVRSIAELRRAGISVAVDDFGQGHSSLAYLRRHPVDVVKIDRDFISALDSNPRDGAIVGAIVGLAHALGMTCVAEGVETDAELQCLAGLGADQVQGYLLGRPRPPADFLADLEQTGDNRHPGLLGRIDGQRA